MKNLPFLIVIAFLLSSCTHYYYVPNTQNVPLMKERNEFHLAAYYGGGDESDCGEFQGAYAISDHVGVAANYIFAKGGDATDYDYANGKCFDGAIGYFKPLGNSGVFEVYGGLGKGSQHHEYDIGSYADINNTKFYIQPAYGISLQWVDLAVSTRLSGVSFNNIRKQVGYDSELLDDLKYLSGQTHFFMEPAVTLRMGWKNVKAQFQYIYSGYLGSSQRSLFEDSHFSLGLFLTFAERYK
jgi:hypothetical protein